MRQSCNPNKAASGCEINLRCAFAYNAAFALLNETAEKASKDIKDAADILAGDITKKSVEDAAAKALADAKDAKYPILLPYGEYTFCTSAADCGAETDKKMSESFKKYGDEVGQGQAAMLPYFVEGETDLTQLGAYKYTLTCLSTTLTASMVTLSALVINM